MQSHNAFLGHVTRDNAGIQLHPRLHPRFQFHPEDACDPHLNIFGVAFRNPDVSFDFEVLIR